MGVLVKPHFNKCYSIVNGLLNTLLGLFDRKALRRVFIKSRRNEGLRPLAEKAGIGFAPRGRLSWARKPPRVKRFPKVPRDVPKEPRTSVPALFVAALRLRGRRDAAERERADARRVRRGEPRGAEPEPDARGRPRPCEQSESGRRRRLRRRGSGGGRQA